MKTDFSSWPTLRGPGAVVAKEMVGGRHMPTGTDRITGTKDAQDRRDAEKFGFNGTAENGI